MESHCKPPTVLNSQQSMFRDTASTVLASLMLLLAVGSLSVFGCAGSGEKHGQEQVDGDGHPSKKNDVQTDSTRGWLAIQLKERTMIRDVVATEPLLVTTDDSTEGLRSRILVPAALSEMYKQFPRSTAETLLAISTFGDPETALKAIAYAESLLDSPVTAASLASYLNNLQGFVDADEDGFVVRDAYLERLEEKIRRLK